MRADDVARAVALARGIKATAERVYPSRSRFADGGGVGPDPSQDLNSIGLYSQAARAADNLQQARGGGQQMLASLRGVKPEEVARSGAQEKFGNQPTVTRDELAQHFRSSLPPVSAETIRQPDNHEDDDADYDPTQYGEYTLPGGENYRETLLKLPPVTSRIPRADIERLSLSHTRADLDRNYPTWRTNPSEGVRNYIEQVERNPSVDPKSWSTAMRAYGLTGSEKAEVDDQGEHFKRLHRDKNFQSSHWRGHPNVVAHMRFTDREEKPDLNDIGARIAAHVGVREGDLGSGAPGMAVKAGVITPKEASSYSKARRFMNPYKDMPATAAKRILHMEELQSDWGQAKRRGEDVPDAPYIGKTEGWTDLGLKHALTQAAHGGYDKFAWTNGEDQADRYSLDKHISSLRYHPYDNQYDHPGHPGGRLIGVRRNGSHAVDQEVSHPDKLPSMVGEDVARRLMDRSNTHPDPVMGMARPHQRLDADDLKMGGEGMRGYYDNLVPKRVAALLKEHDPDVRVGQSVVEGHPHGLHAQPERHYVHSVDITPRMRESIKKNGFKAYADGGEVGQYADGGSVPDMANKSASHFRTLIGGSAPAAAPAQHAGSAPPDYAGPVSIPQLREAFTTAIAHHLSLSPEERRQNRMKADEALAPHVGRRKDGTLVPLLGKNAKMMKATTGYRGEEPVMVGNQGVETAGLALSPSYREGKFNTCPNSASCAAECLGKTSGNYFKVGGGSDLSAFKGPRLNSLNKTLAMMRQPHAFAVRLHDEIQAAKLQAHSNGNHLGVRLNVLSDINPMVHKPIMDAHPDVSFYDYTKNNTDPVAPNHHYTYSSTGLSQPKGLNGLDQDVHNPHSNWKQMRRRLDEGANVAMAFTHKEHLPEEVYDHETGRTYKVVNGDVHDFRPLDIQPEGSPGVIVGLKNKKATGSPAQAAKDSHGFFVHYDPNIEKNPNGTIRRAPSYGLNPESGKPWRGASFPTNKRVEIADQRAAPKVRSNDTGEDVT